MMGLDPLKHGFRVDAGADGTFLVYVGSKGLGFTNVVDLMTWLQRAAQAQQAAEVMTLTEADEHVAGMITGMKDGKPVIGYEAQLAPAPKPAMWPAERALGTMRTTALGSLADRMAAAETPKGAA